MEYFPAHITPAHVEPRTRTQLRRNAWMHVHAYGGTGLRCSVVYDNNSNLAQTVAHVLKNVLGAGVAREIRGLVLSL